MKIAMRDFGNYVQYEHAHYHLKYTQMIANTDSDLDDIDFCVILYEPHREKTRFLPMRKQRRRCNCEAHQRLCFRYTDSTVPLLLKSEISSF